MEPEKNEQEERGETSRDWLEYTYTTFISRTRDLTGEKQPKTAVDKWTRLRAMVHYLTEMSWLRDDSTSTWRKKEEPDETESR